MVILTKRLRRTFSQHLPFPSFNSKTRVGCKRLTKKTLARRKSIAIVHLLGLHKLYILFKCFYGRFSKRGKVQCGIGSILMLIFSHIHNAVNRVIVEKRWQSYFKNTEILFSTKQQGTIRTDCIFYHLCIMVTIFQVASSL